MVLAKNKRGVFFTILVIVILSLFLISFTFISTSEQRKLTERRIETMNNFLFSTEEDLSRQLFISGFRTVFLFNKYMLETGNYIGDTEKNFREAFFNGTINGTTDDDIKLLMEGVTFSNMTSAINEKANKINVKINLTSPVLNITQEDPWNIKITLTTNLSMEDLAGLASWNRTQVLVAYIPIEGFQDPIYPIETGDPSIIVTINQTAYTTITSESELADHSLNTYYINSSDAPSFLDRLEGNLTAESPHGIESIVASAVLSLIPGRSVVDHEYFIGTAGTSECYPGGVNWDKIDTEHRNLYGCQ